MCQLETYVLPSSCATSANEARHAAKEQCTAAGCVPVHTNPSLTVLADVNHPSEHSTTSSPRSSARSTAATATVTTPPSTLTTARIATATSSSAPTSRRTSQCGLPTTATTATTGTAVPGNASAGRSSLPPPPSHLHSCLRLRAHHPSPPAPPIRLPPASNLKLVTASPYAIRYTYCTLYSAARPRPPRSRPHCYRTLIAVPRSACIDITTSRLPTPRMHPYVLRYLPCSLDPAVHPSIHSIILNFIPYSVLYILIHTEYTRIYISQLCTSDPKSPRRMRTTLRVPTGRGMLEHLVQSAAPMLSDIDTSTHVIAYLQSYRLAAAMTPTVER
ncbi:hypothetical protein EVG20_g10581 [Dentipellis fragilis]|uniref:Uncharacterized protein n=1 Tax=Dentipellis fragilis TaxID=205917 RepID=A0A4Y9XSJ6_9AGAM|nr:hypothetical protein EVG20_g10581 [Dentipellis fragilis]